MKSFEPGDEVIVNGSRDLGICAEARPFIGMRCMVVKKTKAGLYLVEHPDGRTWSFALYNLDRA